MNELDLYQGTANVSRARRVQEAGVCSLERRDAASTRKGLSVIVLTRDLADYVVPLVGQLLRQRQRFQAVGLDLQILIGDTGSTEPALMAAYDAWEDRGEASVVRGFQYHFSKCNNALAKRAERSILLFLNNDVVLPPEVEGLLEVYRAFADSPEIGVAGAMLFYPDGRVQCCGVDFLRQAPRRGLPFHPHAGVHVAAENLPAAVSAPATTGSFLAIRRELFVAMGGFSEEYDKEAQDIDLCLRVHRVGLSVKVLNLGKTIHIENGTRPKGEEHPPDRRLFLRRWSSYVEAHFL